MDSIGLYVEFVPGCCLPFCGYFSTVFHLLLFCLLGSNCLCFDMAIYLLIVWIFLQLLISGSLESLDVDDLRSNAHYSGGYHAVSCFIIVYAIVSFCSWNLSRKMLDHVKSYIMGHDGLHFSFMGKQVLHVLSDPVLCYRFLQYLYVMDLRFSPHYSNGLLGCPSPFNFIFQNIGIFVFSMV